MRDGGRLAAAIGVLEDMRDRHKPAHLALKSWGDSARYAGSKDRAFVSGLVLDALRRRRSGSWRIGGEGARAEVLATLGLDWYWPIDRLAEACADLHGPGNLTEAEREGLASPRDLFGAPQAIQGDYPDWADPHFARVYGGERGAVLQGHVGRAPVDLRINILKTSIEAGLKALAPLEASAPGLMPEAARIAPPLAAERAPSIETVPEFGKGWFEVQDLGSQIAAACAGDVVGQRVLDYCAGGGGKTLALAAAMRNTGQLYAYDTDARRLADTVRRGERAGAANLEVRSPIVKDVLADLTSQMDLVFVDAPCTGSGTWRRHPDAKWRLSEKQLAIRMGEQDKVLDAAATYLKPGGRIVYVTCSLFAEENEDRVKAFLARTPGFDQGRITLAAAQPYLTKEGFLRLAPDTSGTDGFFAAILVRRA
ncbi:MAG: RsmB/NOP family class I SAM-dependent RNA methyltransferase [Caulobacteraceae bacterium]